jgi:hypothetical protein
MEEKRPLVFDLRDLNSVAKKDRYSSSGIMYQVIKSSHENDIYKLLNIDESKFFIAIDVEKNINSSMRFFGEPRRTSLPAINKGDSVYIRVIEKNDRFSFREDSQKVILISTVLNFSELIIRTADHRSDPYSVTLKLKSGNQSGNDVFIAFHPDILETCFDIKFNLDGTLAFGSDMTINFPDAWRLLRPDRYTPAVEGKLIAFTLANLDGIEMYFKREESVRNILGWSVNSGLVNIHELDPRGITKVMARMMPYYDKLWKGGDLFLAMAFRSFAKECSRTINGVKVSKLFNEFFDGVNSYENFCEKLESIYYRTYLKNKATDNRYYNSYKFEELFQLLSGYKELRKTALRSQSGRALSKMIEDIEFIEFNEEKYPLIAELIKDGTIPTTTFFRKEGGETYFIFNDNWELFEEFVKKHRDIGIELAQLASRRTTYEKSLMSYMFFILYELPEYLEKHTGKAWTCIPKIVDSPNELEPQKGDDREGVTKKRSALTPVADNENCTVVVPYACLQVPGASTTYTYSLNYSVMKRGLSLAGDVSLSDIEEKLNGRDDYGLMFYTLTGTAVGRGYPTFLIIFERLDNNETRVHFHRVHPLRSKDNDRNPIHNWIKTCYNWMAGNINFDRIRVQQGDLVFVEIDEIPAGESSLVNSYDGHCFDKPVNFTPYSKKVKDNILGYFDITEQALLTHTEHRDRVVPAGKYELRQCRSWEANPKGIWSLRID